MAINVVKVMKQTVVKNVDWFTTNEQFDAAILQATGYLHQFCISLISNKSVFFWVRRRGGVSGTGGLTQRAHLISCQEEAGGNRASRGATTS